MRADGKLKGKREGSPGKKCKMALKCGRFHGVKSVVELCQKRMLEDSGALSREDGDWFREYQAVHEENFLSRRLREDVVGKEEERENVNNEAKEEECRSGKERGGGRKEKGRYQQQKYNLFGSFVLMWVGEFSVLVYFCSDVHVVCQVVFSDSDFDFVEPQTFSLTRKREASVALECETEMNVEGPPVKAAPEAGQKQAHAAKFAERRRHQKRPFATNSDLVRSSGGSI